MLTLAFKDFIRSSGVRAGLFFLLTAGVVSLLIGKQFLDRQRQQAAEITVYQKEEIRRNVKFHPDEMGLLLYYMPFALVNETNSLSGLAIGQRDVNPSVQRVTIRALEAQKYDAGLTNPANLLLGNLDFSFVLIYLFPLLIIAFTYNLVAEERENGTWKIVAVQSRHPFRLVLQLVAIRVFVMLGVLVALLALAAFMLGIPVNAAFGAFGLTSVLYLLFWFAVCFWITSLHRSSSFNAMALVMIWMGLLIVWPAAVNNSIENRYPVPEAMNTMVKQRKAYHEKWDMDKQVTMDRFYAHYPQFKTYGLPDESFSWLWYYAMQQMGDDESAEQSAALREKLLQREVTSRHIAWLVPTLHTQLYLNELAQSGLGNQLRFLDAVNGFHEKKRLSFYPKIFGKAPVRATNWAAIRVETFADPVPTRYAELFMPLVFFGLLFGGLGWIGLKQNVYRL